MIGKVCYAVVKYYDDKKHRRSYKQRPVLIIGGPYENDWIILPISTISRPENRNSQYDFKVDLQQGQLLGLKKECYVRTHKQLTVHKSEIKSQVRDMKADAPQMYAQIMALVKQFQAGL